MKTLLPSCWRPIALLLLISGLLTVGFGRPVAAIAAKTGGLTVSPSFQDVSLTSDQQQVSTTLSYTNHSDSPVTLKLTVVDFGTLDETGGVVLSGSKESELQKKYGLADWMGVSRPDLTIAPQATENVTIDLLNKQTLTPGGHYGAVLATLESNNLDNGSEQVNVNQALSSLYFVKKLGGEVYDLQLNRAQPKLNWFGSITDSTVRFRNQGNVHLVPRGTVDLINPIGQVVARGIINKESGILLPETFRTYTVAMSRLASLAWPGQYQLKVTYHYDGQAKTTVKSLNHFSWGALPLLGVMAMLSLGSLLIWRRRKSII